MNVLLLGADGFLGRHLQIALETAGHTVRRGVHRPVRRADEIAVDYARDVDLCCEEIEASGLDRYAGIRRVVPPEPLRQSLWA